MQETSPHGHRLRRGRISEPGRIYLITFVTHARKPVFKNWWLGRGVVNAMKREADHAQTLCYVVMPDHIHWLMRLAGHKPLSDVVRTIKAASAASINQQRGMQGTLWQRGFHDHAV